MLRMLRRDHHRIHAHRLVVRVILHRYLALAVGPQVRHQSILADLGQPMRQLVRQRDRRRHQLFRLVRRIAEHHALVAGAAGIHAHRNVAGLLVDRRDHRAGIRVEAVERIVITDRRDRAAHQRLKIHIGLGCDLTGDDDQSGAGQRLAGDAAEGILLQAGIENRIGNLIGNLIGMAFGHRFRGEQKLIAWL